MTTQANPPLHQVFSNRVWGLTAIVLAGLVAAMVGLVIGDKSPAVILIAPLAFLVLAASIRYPLIALALLVFSIVTNMSDNLIVEFGLPSIAKISAPALFMLLVLRWALFREKPYVGWLATGCLTLLLTMKLFSATYALNWETSVKLSVDFLKDAIIALLALAFMSQRRGIQTTTNVVVLGVALICALGAYQLVFGRYMGGFRGFALLIENSGRFSGPLGDANFFATIIVFTVPLALFQLLNARGPVSGIVWAGVATLLIVGLLATNSRGGMVGLVVALFVLGTGLPWRQLIVYGLLFAAAVAIAFVAVSPETRAHFATIIGAITTGESVDSSTEGRMASWQVAYNIFKDHSLLGVGVGNFKLWYQDLALELGLIFRGEGRSTHSLYLEYLAEQGLLGLGVLFAILGAAFASVIKAVRTARRAGKERLARHLIAFGAGLAGYLATMTFLQDRFPRFLWLVVALALEMNMIVSYHFAKILTAKDTLREIPTRN